MRWFAGWLCFLGGVAAVLGVVLCATNTPDVPDEDELVWFEGFLIAIRLEYDLDATHIVYLKFRDHDRLYRYLSRLPKYVEVRDRLGIYRQVDVLIDPDAEPGLDGAYDVWGLVEHHPYRAGAVVTYGEVYDEVTEAGRSWQNVGLYTLAGGALALATGFGIRRTVPYAPREPTA